jgi:hypothetical protein
LKVFKKWKVIAFQQYNLKKKSFLEKLLKFNFKIKLRKSKSKMPLNWRLKKNNNPVFDISFGH